ncbi:DUF4349 domain-containing protein [Ornithinimicrobium murale]|uniref:DUF4349 domain-containing protein n=1 Tax=Ornithinimicrobium murale TaxID=1050153 RepID=UPI000E0DB7B4|nr:DUF4349 domain-containing protein [Ornithinimicrobium murale]
MTRSFRSRGRLALVAGAAALTLALAAGCSSGSDESADRAAVPAAADSAMDDSGGGDSGAEAGREESGGGESGADGLGAEGEAAPGSADGEQAQVVSANLPEGRMIARDAQLGIAVEDVTTAAAEVRSAAIAAEGWVVSEEVRPDRGPVVFDGHATLVVSVPSARLDATLEKLGPTGRVTSSNISSLDVTQDYRDTTTRIETLEASITRVRALMEDATDIEDVVLLEGELATREAELDVLKAHAKGLEGDVERSNITVNLTETDPAEPVQTVEDEPTGFAAGVAGGWEAFLGGVTFLLTAIGALLPFAVVAIVLALPVLWWRRRRPATDDSAPAPVDA